MEAIKEAVTPEMSVTDLHIAVAEAAKRVSNQEVLRAVYVLLHSTADEPEEVPFSQELFDKYFPKLSRADLQKRLERAEKSIEEGKGLSREEAYAKISAKWA